MIINWGKDYPSFKIIVEKIISTDSYATREKISLVGVSARG